MLNATFTGSVYLDNNLTEAYYDVIYVRQGVIVKNNTTEYSQYNFNAGDSRHLTQDGDLKENDIIIVRFNTDSNIFDYSKKFVSVAIIYKLESIKIVDVELRGIHLPNCQLFNDIYRIGTEYSLDINNNIDYSWTFRDNIMYQREKLHSVTVFENLKPTEIEYKFENIQDWDSNNIFLYDNYGEYNIEYRMYLFGELLECHQLIKFRKNEPIIDYVLDTPIMNEQYNYTINIIDEDSGSLNIKHYLDGILIYDGMDLTFNNSFIFEKTSYNYKTEVTWFDGFEEHVLVKTGTITSENQKPTIDPVLEFIEGSKNNTHILPNAYDIENDLDYVRYRVYVRKETIFEKESEEYTYVLLDTLYSNINDMSVFINFYKSGNFKIEVQAKDRGSLWSDIKELYVDIECQGSSEGGYFDWSKTTTLLKFSIKENKLVFNTKEEKLKFNINQSKLVFKIGSENIKFKLQEEKIKFSAQQCKGI